MTNELKEKTVTNIFSCHLFCLFTWLQAIKLVFILILSSIIFLFWIRLSCIDPACLAFLPIKKISVFLLFFSSLGVLSPPSVYAKDDIIIIIIIPRERIRENHFRIGKEFLFLLCFIISHHQTNRKKRYRNICIHQSYLFKNPCNRIRHFFKKKSHFLYHIIRLLSGFFI